MKGCVISKEYPKPWRPLHITGHWWLEVRSDGSWSDSALDLYIRLYRGHLRHYPRGAQPLWHEDAFGHPRLKDRQEGAAARPWGAPQSQSDDFLGLVKSLQSLNIARTFIIFSRNEQKL